MYAYVNHTTEDTIIVNRYLQNGSTVTGFVSWTMPLKLVIRHRSKSPVRRPHG